MRLFLAIELDDPARHGIALAQARIKRSLTDGRSALTWIRPEHLHLTLAFLGEVDDGLAMLTAEAFGRAIAADRFAIVFGGLGMFPPSGAPRVLWLGLTAGVAEVVRVQRQVVERVAHLGIVPERRPFHPHLTLARWRTSRASDRDRVFEAAGVRDVARVDVRHVSLLHSRLSPAGPTYTVLARGALSCRRLGDSAAPPLQSE